MIKEVFDNGKILLSLYITYISKYKLKYNYNRI